MQGKFEVKAGEEFSFFSPFGIKEIVQKLLKYSNNYIANRLLLTIGAKTYGTPATLENGIKALKLFSKRHLGLNHLNISEGSGLSRSNLISPNQMMKILIEFMPYHSLLKHQDKDYFKTGTLSGIRTRAGYILGNDNRLYPYVIMVNQKNKSYESILKNLFNRVFQHDFSDGSTFRRPMIKTAMSRYSESGCQTSLPKKELCMWRKQNISEWFPVSFLI